MDLKKSQKIWITALCITFAFLAGNFNGVMDKLTFHYSQSVFPQNESERFLGKGLLYWKPEESWKNKYKDWPQDQRPKFTGAKTWLVWLTDGWHFSQFLMLTFFQLAVALPLIALWRLKWYWALVAIIPFKLAFSAGFTLLFSYLLIRKRNEGAI